MMKKITFVAMLALASSGAFAATACSGTAGNGTAVTNATNGSLFVRVAFTPKCSANVLADYSDAGTSFAVGSGSTKGKSSFAGNTAGGGVSKSGDCPATGCASGDVSTALTAAEALASGS